MDMTSRMTSHFRDAMAACEQSMNVLAEPLAVAVDVLFGALANNGKILACGNGGSAADAQHFIAELVGRFERERLPLAGIALNTDTSILTAVGNDYGFDEIYERQVNAFGQAGDVLVAISTSGNSPNVVRAHGSRGQPRNACAGPDRQGRRRHGGTHYADGRPSMCSQRSHDALSLIHI